VFGYLRLYNSSSWLPLTGSDRTTDILLMFSYVALALPYMYRAVDTGMRAIDVRTLTEAAESLGAKWPTILFRVIFPNVRIAILSGAFLTFATVIGEFTIAPMNPRRWRLWHSPSPGTVWASFNSSDAARKARR
jgi:putative spermidine/putrescine transport system permease protein